MPSSTYTRQMSINSKIYKINNVNTLPSKKNIGTVQRAPHPTARKHPQRNAQKATLMKRGCKEKEPANSSRESRAPPQENPCTQGRGPREIQNPTKPPSPDSRLRSKGTIQGMMTPANPRLRAPTHPPTMTPTVKPQHKTKTHKTPNPQGNPPKPPQRELPPRGTGPSKPPRPSSEDSANLFIQQITTEV